MPRVCLHTLGCKLNFAETSTLAREFERRGYRLVGMKDGSDVTVFNSCAVTEEAERKCRQLVRRARRKNPDGFIVVTGCYAQLRPGEIADIPGVDAVIGSAEKLNLFGLLDGFRRPEKTQVSVSCIDSAIAFSPAVATGERTRAFLKVQDGCDYSCSFCTIPQARGRSRSARVADLVGQAEEVAASGRQEIVLSGVNIGLFGQERGETLLDLLKALDKVDGVERIRISSIEPNLLTDEIIDFVAASRTFQPHFHLPLQSGDDFVLGKMRRRYRRDVYRDRVSAIIDRLPDAGIGVDVIVGFPAETEERFANTEAFINELPVSYLHVFTYSERPHTKAVDELDAMGGPRVPPEERSRRNRRLQVLSETKRRAFAERQIGTRRSVLWEAGHADEVLYGYTDNYVRVQKPFDATWIGKSERVRLGSMADDGTIVVEEDGMIPLVLA